MKLSRYSKSAAALLVGLAAAGALLPTDAPPWALALGVLVNTLAVFLAPRNADPPRFPPPAPTRWQRGGWLPPRDGGYHATGDSPAHPQPPKGPAGTSPPPGTPSGPPPPG